MCAMNGARKEDYEGPYDGAAASLMTAFKTDRMFVDPNSVYHGNRKFVCKQVGNGIQGGVGFGFPAICLVSRNLPNEFNYTYWDVVDAAERLVNAGVRACGAIAINSGHTRDGMIAFRYTWERSCWKQVWFGRVGGRGISEPRLQKGAPRYDEFYRTATSKLAFCSSEYKQHGNIPGMKDRVPPKDLFLYNSSMSDLNVHQLHHELEGKSGGWPDNNNTRTQILTTSDRGPYLKDKVETTKEDKDDPQARTFPEERK